MIRQFQFGQVTLTIEAPDGLPAIGLDVDVHPQTEAEADAFIEACGGIGAFEIKPGFSSLSIGESYPPKPDGAYAHVTLFKPHKLSRSEPREDPWMAAMKARQRADAEEVAA